MVVCITGMHRSGTSMVARLLNLCGLYLGDEAELVGAAADNPEGFWENVNFVDINNSLMSRFNGAWDIPPTLQLGWETTHGVKNLKDQAEELIKQFDGHLHWGWKDPRNSITFPFWMQLIPDLKVIICLRNPLDVAHSLARRGYATNTFSFNLWHIYNQRIIEFAHPDNHLISHYDSYFLDPKAELRRLLEFIGMPVEEEIIDSACATISKSMRHSQSTVDGLVSANAPEEMIKLYLDMCSQSGPAYWGSLYYEVRDMISTEQRSESTIDKLRLLVQLADMQKILAAKQDIIVEKENIIAEKEITIAKKEKTILEQENAIEIYQSDVKKRVDEIQSLQTDVSHLQSTLLTIQSGLLFRAADKYRRIIERFLSDGTRRRRFYTIIIKSMRILLDEGPRGLWNRITHRFGRTVSTQPKKKIEPNSFATFYEGAITTAYGQPGSEFIQLSKTDLSGAGARVKLIAFYLPQFHPIPENDQWWGKGFTEWTNVSKAVPQFVGHYQPHLPGELGFYDLRLPAVQRRQVELAKKYGIHGFCFYYYWFSGKRLLERPLEQFIEDPEIDFPFCVCWANENWTRRWDGRENDILIAQEYSEENDLAFIRDLVPIFKHRNYIRINNRPVLIVYRTQLLPDAAETAKCWREYCIDAGVGNPYLIAAQVFESIDPEKIGFDAAVEFPPNTSVSRTQIDQGISLLNSNYKGGIFSYSELVKEMIDLPKPSYQLYKTVCPSWDNEARRPGQGSIFAFSSPGLYKNWLNEACRFASEDPDPDKRIVFINAWNEWAEGAYLEPDRRYGYAYLQATADVLLSLQEKRTSLSRDWTILFVTHDAHRGGAQVVLLNTIAWLRKYTSIRVKVLSLNGGFLLSHFRKLADTLVLNDLQTETPNAHQDEILNQLLRFCEGKPDLIYGNTVAAGQIYGLLSRLGSPILTHFHELETSINRYASAWIRTVLEHSTHYIACSRAVSDNLVKNHGVDPDVISVIYSSISIDSSTDLSAISNQEKKGIRKKLGLKNNKLLIFGCGLGMPFRKGADLFIEVARILLQKGRDDFHFYWIGDFEKNERNGNGKVWADYLKELRQSNLKDYVTFLGLKENPKEYLQAGDIFILPSREDPFPLVALEAAECGLPIVCFQGAGGMPDFVEEDAGYIVPFEDVEQMAESVSTLIKDEDLRQTLSSGARKKLIGSFTAERTSPQILSLCRQLSGKKPSVSVIVPNYNHAEYLPERLESIFNQTYRDFEVILLDDASTDNSLDVLERYSKRADVQIVRNKQNSGSSFKQWFKGVDLSKAYILWFAESDDLCEPDFLKTLLPAFNDPKVKIAYANSHVINEDDKVIGDYTNMEYLTSISPTRWNANYQTSAEQEINQGLGIKNTILSASSVLFRKVEPDPDMRNCLEEMRIAGDWYFIVQAIKGGDVYYEARKLNYHRRHSQSVIGKLIAEKRGENFFREIEIVHRFIFQNYSLEKDFVPKWESYLRRQWNDFFPNAPFEKLEEIYPYKELKNILIGPSTLKEDNQTKPMKTLYKNTDPIIVYNMGKVGSRSIFDTLESLNLEAELHHAHLLHNLEKIEENLQKKLYNPTMALTSVKQGRWLRERIEQDTAQPWKIITLVRDPLAQDVSRFFQAIEAVIPDIRKRAENDDLIHDLAHAYFQKWDHHAGLVWFDRQFRPVFEINVYGQPFPIEKGYDIFKKGRFSVLLLRLDDLQRCASVALEEFLGINNVPLRTTNVSARKWYANIYRRFTSEVSMPEELLDFMYDSKLATHFYAEAERSAFRSKWKSDHSTISLPPSN